MKIFILLVLTVAPLFGEQPAPAWQRAIQAEREGQFEEARGLLESILANAPNNSAARRQLHRVIERQSRSEALRTTLSKIILPRVSLEDVSAREAIEYLTQAISQSRPGFRLNTVWMVPPEHPGRVSLQLDAIPASEALRYAAEAAGLRLGFEEHAVKITAPLPLPTPDPS